MGGKYTQLFYSVLGKLVEFDIKTILYLLVGTHFVISTFCEATSI